MKPFGYAIVVMLATSFTLAMSADEPTGRAPTRGLLLVTNKGDQALSIVDPETGREIARVKETGFTAHEVAASPDGRTAYAPIFGNSGVGKPGTDGRTIDVIDLASRRVVATIDLGRATRPHCAKFGTDGMLYVSTELTNSIDVIDPLSRRIVASIPTEQPESHMLVITRDGKRAYTSNVHVGTVSAIDLVARKPIAVIPVSSHAQRISLSIDDRYAFTSDQTKPQLAVIDTSTNQVKTWVQMPGIGYGTAPTLDGEWLVVALINVNKVVVVNLRTMKVERAVDVPRAPQEVLIRPDNREAYISCDASKKIAVLNLKTWKVDKLIDVGRGADGLAWASAP